MDLNNLQAWQYFAIAGGGVLVLGVIAYFLPVGKMKMPAVITAAFGGVVAGIALGVLLMAGFGYKAHREEPLPSDMSGPPGLAGAPKGLTKGQGKGPGGPMGGFGGPPAPSSRDQLASLVAALDTVADRPLTVSLTPEEKSAIVKELKALSEAPTVNNDEAKARLDAMLKIVEKHREALQTVGFRTGPLPKTGSGLEKENPNPFKSGPAAEHVKSLLERLSK
jgi:hypothetical protein